MKRIHEAELRLQYREFNRRLEELSKMKGSKNLSSLQILGKFVDPKENLYKRSPFCSCQGQCYTGC